MYKFSFYGFLGLMRLLNLLFSHPGVKALTYSIISNDIAFVLLLCVFVVCGCNGEGGIGSDESHNFDYNSMGAK